MAHSFEIQITGFPPPADAFTASHSSCGVPLTCTHANSLFSPNYQPIPSAEQLLISPVCACERWNKHELEGDTGSGAKIAQNYPWLRFLAPDELPVEDCPG